MSVAIAVQPFAEPITVAEMKIHLKQDSGITEDDDLIRSQIASARDVVETMTGTNVKRQKVMIDTTFTLKLDYFPSWTYIEVPRVPLVSVSSITYLDAAGDSQTWASSNYTVDTASGRIYLTYSGTWPTTQAIANAVTVTFIAGMAATFSAATSDVVTISGRAMTAGDRVRVLNSGGALPAGLSALTDYFVIAGPKFSATSGGSAVDVTGTGSGTHYLGTDLAGFETLRNAVKLLVGFWYENRQAVSVSAGVAAVKLPMAVEALVASQHA